jgi:hypothetical protein
MQTASFLLPHLPAAGGSLCDLQLLLVRVTKWPPWRDRHDKLGEPPTRFFGPAEADSTLGFRA